MEFGIYTFVEATPDPTTGVAPTPTQRLAQLLKEAELADQVGLDVFGVGEHHRADYLASAPAVILAAAAARTGRIRLTSASAAGRRPAGRSSRHRGSSGALSSSAARSRSSTRSCSSTSISATTDSSCR